MADVDVLQMLLAGQTAIAADVSALREQVGRALTHLEVIDQRNLQADTLHRDFEARLRVLERFRWTLMGTAAIGSVISGIVGYWVGHLIR